LDITLFQRTCHYHITTKHTHTRTLTSLATRTTTMTSCSLHAKAINLARRQSLRNENDLLRKF
jgi:hypothetical protein